MKTRIILVLVLLLIFNVVLIAQAPDWQWATQAGGTGWDRGYAITTDATENCYVTGYFKVTATFGDITLTSSGDDDIFVAKMDTDGNWLWATKAGGNSEDVGYGITIDADGNSYVTGMFEGTATFGSYSLTSNGSSDIFVAKMDTAGNWQWATRAGGSSWDEVNGITIDDAGNTYVTGSFYQTATFGSYSLTSSGDHDIFVAKMDADGNWQWATKAGGTNADEGRSITIDDAGNCFVTGNFSGTATFGSNSLTSNGSGDIFVAKMDTAGNWQWATQAVGTDYEQGNGITIDDAGNSYVTGRFYETASFGSYSLTSSGSSDIFVAKMDSNGNWQWATRAGGNSYDGGDGITTDDAGNSYVTGYFVDTATFGSYSLISSGLYDIFVAKMDTDGNWQWANRAGGNSEDVGYGITIDADGNSYVTGIFMDTATFGSNSLTSSGSYGYPDIFVAKLNNNISYDITFNSLADMNTARYGFGYCNDENYLYAIDGGTYEPPYYRVNNIERYDPTTNNWEIFVDGLIPRRYCRAEYIQSTNSIYIFGGQIYYVSNPATYTDTVDVVDVANGNITYLTSNPIPNTSSGSAVLNNKIYIFGGSQHGVYSSELYEFDPINNVWTQLPDMPEAKQTEGEVVDGILYVFGGYNGSVSNRIDAYDIQNSEWSFIDYMPVGISAHHTTVSGQYIWLIGGYDNLESVAVFNTETHEFTQLSNNMIGRRHCGTEVIGNSLYVFGGNIATYGPALSSLQYADISYLSINDEPNVIPSTITLFQNYPNPFYPKTTISFYIKQNCKIELEIFNIRGQKVKTLINDFMQPGYHTISWDGDNAYRNKVSSGLYFYKLSVNGITEVVKKCLLVK